MSVITITSIHFQIDFDNMYLSNPSSNVSKNNFELVTFSLLEWWKKKGFKTFYQ